MIHFIRPFWLYALIPAFLYLIWIIYSYRQQNPWKKVCDPHLLAPLLESNRSTSQHFIYLNIFLFYVIGIVALSGPAWKKTNLPIYRDISSTMVILDLSQAMLETDITPNRLMRAKLKIRDLINTSQNVQMGLVAFSGEAFVAAPLSKDASTLNALIAELDPGMMPIAGSDMGEGLKQGLNLLKQAGTNHSNIVLITASEPTSSSWEAAKQLLTEGNQLNILAMMVRNQSTQATLNNLERLAEIGGGSLYLFTNNDTDIQNILQNNSIQQTIRDENVGRTFLWSDGGPWFCLLLIPLALLLLREKVRDE